jgi:predicted dienelactone hydrolase
MRYLASHGWVVVAPEHTGNTLLDTPSPPLPIALWYWRSTDVTEALNVLGALPSSDPLGGRADTRTAILSGHSFGIHTTWASAGATFDLDAIRPHCNDANRCTAADLAVFARGVGDPRFVAVIPMAGAIDRSYFGPDGHRGVRVPVFSMSGTADRVGADTQFATTAGVDVTWIEVRGGCHQFFGLGHCDQIDDALQGPIVGTYALAFARRHLLGDADPTIAAMLDGSRPVHERVAFRRHDAGM